MTRIDLSKKQNDSDDELCNYVGDVSERVRKLKDAKNNTIERVLEFAASHKTDLSGFKNVEDCDLLGNFSDLEDCDFEELVNSDRLEKGDIVKMENEMPVQSNLLSVFGSIGIESTVFEHNKRFYPFTRQHRVLYEIGPLVKNGWGDVEIVFCPVGFEWFTSQFKNSLGIMSEREGVIGLTTVSNIMYAVRYLPKGAEYVVFDVVGSEGRRKSYLWDSERIIEVFSSGPSYGVYTRNLYHVIYGHKFEFLNDETSVAMDTVVYLPTTQVFSETRVRGMLCNINGVDYVIPVERLVCLTNVDGKMCDASHKEYPVDRLAIKNGIYVIDSPYKLQCDTEQRVDSTKSVMTMRDSVITLSDFVKYFKIPRGSLSRAIPVRVTVVNSAPGDTVQVIDRRYGVPFFSRSDGMSKNAAVCSNVTTTGLLTFDPLIDAKCLDRMFIGNCGFCKYEYRRTVVQRRNGNHLSYAIYNNRADFGRKGYFVVAMRRSSYDYRRGESPYYFLWWGYDKREVYAHFAKITFLSILEDVIAKRRKKDMYDYGDDNQIFQPYMAGKNSNG